MIKQLNKTLAEHKIKLELTEKMKKYLAEKGFDPDFGARPLKRAIQNYIQNPLSLELLEGNYMEGDIIRVDLDNQNKIRFEKIGQLNNQ